MLVHFFDLSPFSLFESVLTNGIVMIILFLKYYSVRKSDTPEKKDRGAVKEIKETRIVHDKSDNNPSTGSLSVSTPADVGESLG